MNIQFAVGRYCSRISKEAEVEAEFCLCLRTISVERLVLLSTASRWPVVKVSVPGDTMGWLNDCVTTSVKGASSPRMYIVGTKRKSRGEGEGKLAGSSGVLSKTE